MKKITSKKLANRLVQYGALTAAIGGVAEVGGQVMYTDIADFSGNGTSVYDLDLNGDNVIDFNIFGGSDVQILIDGDSAGNSVAGVKPSYVYPFALDEGTVIDANQSWQSGTGQILRYIGSDGNSCGFSSNWCDQNGDNDDIIDKFLGLQFKVGGNTHYGWVRLDLIGTNTVGSWVIKDYAYEATPNTAITAGAGSLGIDDIDNMSKVKVVVLNNNIGLSNLPEAANYKLFSITGQNVLNGSTTANRHDIETSSITTGLYILELENSNTKAIFRKKVIL